MTVRELVCVAWLATAWAGPAMAAVQQAGSIRGVVFDADFNVPLAAAQVLVVETGSKTMTTEQGNYALPELPPGKYTLVFSKDGYVRQVRTDVVVVAGQLTDIDVFLAGEFTDMEEFVVEDLLKMEGGSEVALLDLRFESPALLDSIGADLTSRAGASDAASALRLVAGATVQDGKYAVVRGLPDRYVSSQLNGVRLPSADEDKRAVELDQFPSVVIDSIRVSKTFTPDQQGDASGGAVDIRLRGIPAETVIQFSGQLSGNSQAFGRDDFLTYKGGGVNTWGRDDGRRDIQTQNIGAPWDGAVGVSEGDAPIDHKWNLAAGGSREIADGVKLGASGAFFYERDSYFIDDGVQDSWWVTSPGAGMSPEYNQGTPSDGDFRTQLFDVRQASQSVQWGGMGLIGLETENHSLDLAYLYSRTAEDVATLAEDTRSKHYFFPGYDPYDNTTPGHQERDAAPYLRLETLEYTERTTSSLILSGRHKLPVEGSTLGEFHFKAPELDWTLSASDASMYQPDKRVFGGAWRPEFEVFPGFTIPAGWQPYKPAANFTVGNLQRIWKEIDEESTQASINLKLPFEQWSGDTGSLKFGGFADRVDRKFDQDTFSNFGVNSSFDGDFTDSWSAAFPSQNQPINASFEDVDYKGKIAIDAFYGMADLPLNRQLSVVGGARFESTSIQVVNDPEQFALWFPPGATAPVTLVPGAADVDYENDVVLPALGVNYEPIERLVFRAAYSETVARQTFKELTPIIQQEYLGGPIFIGNPDLQMSSLRNYDLRVDYTPYEGGFMSLSWFYKDITDPIEYVQQFIGYNFTTARNYPKGRIRGIEAELRQDLGRFWKQVEGLSVGVNATFIDSEVTLPADEAAAFNDPNIQAPMPTRDMTNAPESLLNLYLLYEIPSSGTQFGLFYTVQGDTLVTGATQSVGNFIPSIYATQYDSLNLSIAQRLGKHFTLQLQAKNLTNPTIEEVFRSDYIPSDVTRRSYSRGVELALTLGARFSF